MTEERRKALNLQRLPLIDVSIRANVVAVLRDLETHGLKPLIHADVWRSPAKQEELQRAGTSKVKWGFHCATRPDGSPGSLAADIIDANKAWEATIEFWLKLGASALAQKLGWGGLWGLPVNLKDGLLEVIRRKAWNEKPKLGWDVAHIETARVTIAEARAGKR